MRYNKLFFLIFWLYSVSFWSQSGADTLVAKLPPSTNDDVIAADSLLKQKPTTSNTLYPKAMAPDFKNRYKDKDYDYSTIKPRESLWGRIRRKLDKWLYELLGDFSPRKADDWTIVALRVFAVLIVAGILYFLLQYLVGKDGNFFFGKRNKTIKTEGIVLDEDIHEINFPLRIAELEQAQNFRWAIRYQFLYVLKKLSDKKIIDWNPEKTNRDYINELKDAPLKKHFSDLSHIFDYVWYGEFPIDATRYQQYKTQYNDFSF